MVADFPIRDYDRFHWRFNHVLKLQLRDGPSARRAGHRGCGTKRDSNDRGEDVRGQREAAEVADVVEYQRGCSYEQEEAAAVS